MKLQFDSKSTKKLFFKKLIVFLFILQKIKFVAPPQFFASEGFQKNRCLKTTLVRMKADEMIDMN